MNQTELSSQNEINSTNIEQLMSLLSSGKRTKLHTKSVNSWLRKRFPSQTSLKYLYFPEELLQHENIKEIFQSFDRDNSHSLDIGELVKMFKGFNINIDRPDLKKLFDVVDQDKDNALNFDEFKNCALSEQGQQVFNRIMKKVRKEEENRPLSDRNVYLPLSFSSMITYISYRSMRRDVLDQVLNKELDMSVRADKFASLKNLQDLYGIKNDENSKIKEKILLSNPNVLHIKVEPLLRQLSNLKDLNLRSPELLGLDLSPKRTQDSSFPFGPKSLLDESERHVGGLRKSIEKLQRESRKSIGKFQKMSVINEIPFNLKFMESKNELKNEKKEENLVEEIGDIKKDAEFSGRLKAVRLFNLQKVDKKETDVNEILTIAPQTQKKVVQKPPKTNRFKNFEKLMNENIKMAEISRENKKFRKLLGMEEIDKKPLSFAKTRRTKGKNAAKSTDFKEDSQILAKMKEINKKQFDLVLPKLEEIKKIQSNNSSGKFQKLPEIKIFQRGSNI